MSGRKRGKQRKAQGKALPAGIRIREMGEERIQENELEKLRQKQREMERMVDILSSIVEFRNGENGAHTAHVRKLTGELLSLYAQKADGCRLTEEEIETISMAAELHDIGKIALSEEILNKRGQLTREEFSVMKEHALLGANMIRYLPFDQEEPLLKAAYEICRWHHERYDGGGYPDGLIGDAIPLSAQAAGLADAADVLISDRIYRKAYSREKAFRMIADGECGAFQPLLIECLRECL